MINPELKDFLHKNPYPSLSFLPIDNKVVFFLQDETEMLLHLLGKVLVEISFFEESHAHIMRMSFMLKGEPAYTAETEFYKDFPNVLESLFELAKQDHFTLLLYDKKTMFLREKLFTFNKEMLRDYLSQQENLH